MSRFASVLFVFMFLFISSASSNADHTDTFKQDRQQAQEEDYSYKNSEMARFVILKQAKDRKNALLASLDNWPAQKNRLIHNTVSYTHLTLPTTPYV